MVPPPTPFQILRVHQAPLSALCFTLGNTYLFAGDQDGYVSMTDLSARRVVASWHAHEGGILGVGEWEHGVVSQGRDNKIHFYKALPISRASSAAPRTEAPEIVRSLDSNSLNFCRFSLIHLPNDGKGKGKEKEMEGLLALPSLADSELIDIYHVPSLVRIHSAINYVPRQKGPDDTRSGLVMSVHLHVLGDRLVVAAGYEDGRVEVWSSARDSLQTDAGWDGRRDKAGVWTRLWEGKLHNEAVMAMAVDRAFTRAFTVSADHFLCRVDLSSILDGCADETVVSSYSTKQIGNGSVAVSSDGKVVAAGGWDGRIRLFSATTFKPLGTLAYHRESVHALAFANSQDQLLLTADEEVLELGEESDSDSDEEAVDAGPRERWLASGGKDRRIALWSLMDFSRA